MVAVTTINSHGAERPVANSEWRDESDPFPVTLSPARPPRSTTASNSSGAGEWVDRDERIGVSRWEPIDLGPVLRGEVVTSPPTVFERADGIRLLYPGRINAFIGETETCKTWMALAAVAQELQAEHHVIYVDFEDCAESAVERLRALGVTPDRIGRLFTYLNPGGRFDELAQAVVLEAIAAMGHPSLVVFDGVTEAMADLGLDPLSGTDVAIYYAGSPRWMANTGAATLVLDHVTKSTESRGRWAIGSERKLSGLDGAAYGFESLVTFGRGKTGLVKMTVAKDRSGHIRQHEAAGKVIAMAELKSWPDDGVTVHFGVPEVATDGNFRPTYLMAKLSETIIKTPGLSTRALNGAVTGKTEAKALAIEMLVVEAYVEVRPGPRNANLHYSLRPFGGDPGPVDQEDE